MQFYDSDIQSKKAMSDIQSERDIPKEKLHKPKLIFKTELFRVHKEIRRIGLSHEKAAYYDLVTYKSAQITEEQYQSQEFEHGPFLDALPTQSRHIEKEYEWIDKTLSALKRDEVVVIIQEYLKLDQNDMKVLDHKEYYLFQMIDWVTFIDMFQDGHYIKELIKKGKRGDRCERLDEIKLTYSIQQGDQSLITYTNDQFLRMEDVQSDIVKKILKSMKKGEHCRCKVSYESFSTMEPQLINDNKSDVIVDIHLHKLYKIDDIYHDGMVFKKSIYRGYSTASPDKISLVDFDLWIYQNTTNSFPKLENLIWSSTEAQPFYDKAVADKKFGNELVEDVKPSEGSLHYYIDDIRISKLLRLSLLKMKKNELAIITCHDRNLIKTGLDYDKIKDVQQQSIVYVLHVYDFTEGKNNFNMNIDEKIEQFLRKKQIALQYIAAQNYKKALKVFRTTNAYFDYGSFNEQDKLKMKEYQIASLLNSSLCQMKLKLWKDMLVVGEKLYALDSSNPKIIYRYCFALRELFEFDKALEILSAETQNEDLLTLKNSILKLKHQYEQKQKQAFSKLFD